MQDEAFKNNLACESEIFFKKEGVGIKREGHSFKYFQIFSSSIYWLSNLRVTHISSYCYTYYLPPKKTLLRLWRQKFTRIMLYLQVPIKYLGKLADVSVYQDNFSLNEWLEK